ncbi:hypothetical protein [Hymenobacter algoricola]|uniref:Uncharacterized protein n=1 Tax=Hymenobacter algoricola TaxID=486267 RepID=A0ABP7MCJ6_9BACT
MKPLLPLAYCSFTPRCRQGWAWLLLPLLLALPRLSYGQTQVPTYEWATTCASYEAGGFGPTKLVVDGQGNTYVCGTFTGTTLIGNTTLTTSGPDPGKMDVYVAKLNAQGQYLWVAQAGGDGEDFATGLALDGQGHVYVGGLYNSFLLRFGGSGTGIGVYVASSQTDGYVAQLDAATGAWQWARRMGGTGGESVAGLAADAAGNVYVAGNFSSRSATFGPFTLLNAYTVSDTRRDIFVARLDATGTWQWAQRTGGVGEETVRDMVRDPAGGLYLIGDYTGRAPYSVTFGTTTLSAPTGVGTNNSAGDAYVAYLSESGAWQWAEQTGNNTNTSGSEQVLRLTNLTLDGSRHLFVTGDFRTLNMRLGATVLTNVGSPVLGVPYVIYRTDVFVARFDMATRSWAWASRAGGVESDAIGQPVVDALGRVFVGGYIRNDVRPPFNNREIALAQLDASTGAWQQVITPTPGFYLSSALAFDTGGKLHI